MFNKKKKETFLDDTVNEDYIDSSSADDKKNDIKELPVHPVQSVIPIKEIYKGMIVTSDGRYVKIVEILPINFSLRSADEQDNIIHLFSSWLRVSPIRLQFKVVTRRADSENIVNNVRYSARGETVEKCKDLTENYISFIRNVSGQEALTRRFFIVFEYEPNSARQRTIDEIAAEMDITERRIRGGLAACGNETVIPRDNDYALAEILYTFYNRASCQTESFDKRVRRVTFDYMRTHGLDVGKDDIPAVPVANYVAPRGIDFSNPDFFICDGMYYSILLVTRDGYPTSVLGGWMSVLVETGDGVDIDIILNKENRQQMNEKVALKLKLNRIKESSRYDTDTDYEEIEGAVNSAKYIKTSMAAGEDMYHMYTFITVSAETHELLTRRLEAVNDYLYSSNIITQKIRYRLEDAFQVTSPLLIFKPELMQFSSRNVMTSGAASAYPFTSCVLCDENGIVLGINRQSSSLVNIDIYDSKKYKNANIAILGTSGSGKTFTELTMALRMRIQGIQTFIIAPDKAHEFQRACTHISGSYIRISPGSKDCINIMEIRPVVSPISEFLDEVDASEMDSWLSQKTSQLLTFFHILIPDLTNEEEQLVDEGIIKTYSLFGITHDNNSVYEQRDGKGKTLKKMPIIGDLYETLRERPETRRVANILGRFVTGSASSFNRQTNVDLNNKFIVFDLEELTGTLKAVGMFIVMDFLWARIKENRAEKKAVFIDEGWQLIGASSDSRAADFVYRIFKIIRGYGGSAIFATQDISDLFAFQDGKYGKAIISNSKIKIVLGLEQQEAKAVQEVLQLTKNELRSIINFNRGEALVCANSNKLPVFVRASELEHELITTDREELQRIIQQRQQQREEERMAARFSQQKQEDKSIIQPNNPEAINENLSPQAAQGASHIPQEYAYEHQENNGNIGDCQQNEYEEHTPERQPQPMEYPVVQQENKDAILNTWAMEQLETVARDEASIPENERFEHDPNLLIPMDKSLEDYADAEADIGTGNAQSFTPQLDPEDEDMAFSSQRESSEGGQMFNYSGYIPKDF